MHQSPTRLSHLQPYDIRHRWRSAIGSLILAVTPPAFGNGPTDPEDEISDQAELGIELQVASEWHRNATLNDVKIDEERAIGAELTASVFIPLDGGFSVFGEATALTERTTDRDSPSITNGSLERGELWLRWEDDSAPLAFTIGRQNFSDARQWWWDEDLDALQIQFASEQWAWNLALARQALPQSTLEDEIHPAEDDVVRALGNLRWNWAEGHSVDAFALLQRDRSSDAGINALITVGDESDADLNWYGLRVSGEFSTLADGHWAYHLGAAYLRGTEVRLEFSADDEKLRVADRQDLAVRGWAIDASAQWRPPGNGWPTVFAGYALGSGDRNPDDDTDRRFRQTGLQNNETLYRYYGELFAPELANIEILSAGIRLPVGEAEDSVVALVYHRYRVREPTADLGEVGIDLDPDQHQTSLGWEADLIIKHWLTPNINLEAIAAVFAAGSAYGEAKGERALRGYLEMTIEF